jgi:hypothetical protein
MATEALVVALIAIGLSIVTLMVVLVSRAGTARARADARAALTALERQAGAGYRPLLVDVPTTGPAPPDVEAGFAGLEPRPFDPRSVFVAFESGNIYVSVPVRNVGHGVAVIDGEGIELTGPFVGALEHRPAPRAHVPVGETARVELIADDLGAEDGSTTGAITWQLTVPYGDLAGQQQAVARLQIAPRQDDVRQPWRVERVDQVGRDDVAPDAAWPAPTDVVSPTSTVTPAPIDSSGQRAGVRNEPVVDLWGNPVRPNRRKR